MNESASPLAGRTAIVTGVSRRTGIGFAIARRLGRLGAKLFLHSWTDYDRAQPWGAESEGGSALASLLRNEGFIVESAEGDFFDPDTPAQLISAATNAVGHVDILIANHAYSAFQSLSELTADETDRHLLVNIRGTLLLVQAFAAQHDGRPGGRVVMMTSGQHLGPMEREVAYAVSKGAIHQITPTLSRSLIPRGITVNTINPGPTDTGWANEDERAEVTESMPLRRWGAPDDAARLIAWLCTDDAHWITGEVINSEGGFRR